MARCRSAICSSCSCRTSWAAGRSGCEATPGRIPSPRWTPTRGRWPSSRWRSCSCASAGRRHGGGACGSSSGRPALSSPSARTRRSSTSWPACRWRATSGSRAAPSSRWRCPARSCSATSSTSGRDRERPPHRGDCRRARNEPTARRQSPLRFRSAAVLAVVIATIATGKPAGGYLTPAARSGWSVSAVAPALALSAVLAVAGLFCFVLPRRQSPRRRPAVTGRSRPRLLPLAVVAFVLADLALFVADQSSLAPAPAAELSARGPLESRLAALAGDGRVLIVDPQLSNGKSLDEVGGPDLGVLSELSEAGGYSSIMWAPYATSTGTHTDAGASLTALANGTFASLGVRVALVAPTWPQPGVAGDASSDGANSRSALRAALAGWRDAGRRALRRLRRPAPGAPVRAAARHWRPCRGGRRCSGPLRLASYGNHHAQSGLAVPGRPRPGRGRHPRLARHGPSRWQAHLAGRARRWAGAVGTCPCRHFSRLVLVRAAWLGGGRGRRRGGRPRRRRPRRGGSQQPTPPAPPPGAARPLTSPRFSAGPVLCRVPGVMKRLSCCGGDFAVGREGFEPSKAAPTDLQSAPFGHLGTDPRPVTLPGLR